MSLSIDKFLGPEGSNDRSPDIELREGIIFYFSH